MAYPKELRNQLGIGQNVFATLIKCNIGQLAMAEIGKRSLPNISSQYLAALELAVAQTINNQPETQVNNKQTTTWLNRHIRTCEATKLRLLLQQDELQNKIQAAQTLLQVAKPLAGKAIFAAATNQGLQLQVLKRKAQEKLNGYQLKLMQVQISIAALQAQITTANTFIIL